MAPSSRVLMLAQMGFVLQDWDELQALGETATQRRASADNSRRTSRQACFGQRHHTLAGQRRWSCTYTNYD